MKLKKFLFRNLFFQYKKFFSYDIEFSLVCNRNFDYIEAIRFLLLPMFSNENAKQIDDDTYSHLTKHIQSLHSSILGECVKKYESYKERLKNPIIFDGRNQYNLEKMNKKSHKDF